MFESEFLAHDIKVESVSDQSYDKNDVEWVCLDPSRLTQILINLITNAIKFTKLEEKRVITVRTSASVTKPPSVASVTWFPTNKMKRDVTHQPEWGTGEHVYLCFEVSDTGRGLEQEEMMRLFNRFQQATAKTHIKYGGSGLGLFISRELTETQGGEIGVMSNPGVGSTFTFYVKGRRAEPPQHPDKVLQPPDVRAERRRSRQGSASRPNTGTNTPKDVSTATDALGKSFPPSKPSILLVEDNIVNAKVLSKQLEKAGCDVHVANHGLEAIDFITHTRCYKGMESEKGAIDFDCVLMDVEMPVMDGLTATRRIRQLEQDGVLTKHLNIIAITANARQEQINTTMNAGADDVLPKPFRVAELLTKIKEVSSKNSS